jgi:DNA invertase Pin-like site-specific DNA recombinase
MTTIGYARVSTDGQTLDAQHATLRDVGCERVFSEKQSGAKTDRQQLARALAALSSGDTLIVTKLDPLGDQWADTTTPHGRLMLTVLGGLAEFERHLIFSRTAEGRIRAQARGVKFGRGAKLTPHQRAEALARRASGEACVDIARSYAVSHSTISRL